MLAKCYQGKDCQVRDVMTVNVNTLTIWYIIQVGVLVSGWSHREEKLALWPNDWLWRTHSPRLWRHGSRGVMTWPAGRLLQPLRSTHCQVNDCTSDSNPLRWSIVISSPSVGKGERSSPNSVTIVTVWCWWLIVALLWRLCIIVTLPLTSQFHLTCRA